MMESSSSYEQQQQHIHLDFTQASINISVSDPCPVFCDPVNPSGFCPSPCLSICSSICRYSLSYLIPPPPSSLTTFSSDHQSRYQIAHKLIPYLIVTLAVLVTAFVLVCHYSIYVKFRRNRLRARFVDNNIGRNVPGQQLLDEEHGPEIDNPIWYIRTVGLQSSVISAITVCRYRRGDGLVEGTDCAVCLSEFEEDETLRLLPKCNHAFHIPCIDTWLQSHTNCPICRAGIVVNSIVIAPSPELTVGSLVNSDEARLEAVENNEEYEYESGTRVEQVHNSKEEASELLPMRRQDSMNSASSSMIHLETATATVTSIQSNHNLNHQLAE